MIGEYRNKHDGSILEIYRIIERKEVKYKARWTESETKKGLEFDVTKSFNKFETFEKI